MNQDLRYILALMTIKGIGSIRARHLIEAFGSAQAVFEADASLITQIPSISQALLEGRNNQKIFQQADQELQFIEQHHIKTLIYGQEGYPHRLLDCPDAPTLLFQVGQTNLDATRIVSIVGTRNCTQYGRDMVHRFVKELKEMVPEVIIISGLALGIDVESHKASLDNDVPTVGVVAHGMDRIYPSQHRSIAQQMVKQGGSILGERTTYDPFERSCFLSRNRIIAGLADATIVAESKSKGGSLVTASIANDYGRDIFAFPGRVGDSRSEGCNRLIRLNRAGLITCAQDFVEAMNWDTAANGTHAIQQSIPFEEENLSPTERLIIDALRDRGDLRISQLSDATNLDHATLLEVLLDLEMNGKIRNCPGGVYQLR